MPKKSQRKGASAEREFAKLLEQHTGITSVRNLEARRTGGHDLLPEPDSLLDEYAFEVKRYATVTDGLIAGWWQQAVRQAETAGKVPCLAYRADRQSWRVMLPMEASQELDHTTTMYLPGFIAHIQRDGNP